jgi:4-amino-4-deoxy-L-arabinose transferase-like glycosyltransferase
MASIVAQDHSAVGKTGLRKSSAAMTQMKREPRAVPMGIAVILLAAFFVLQSRVPLRTAIQIGADEGFDLAKATLCLHGHRLYSEVWNDQPPLHTWLVTQVLKHVTPGIAGPRLVTVAFAAILVVGVFVIVCRASGLLTGALTGALVIASPGFLELSSSCMLEIPALATALAGLGVLVVLPRTRWYGAEWVSGILFGMAGLMKLVPLYLLPVAALIIWLRLREQRARETREIRERGASHWSNFHLFRRSAVRCCEGWRGLAGGLSDARLSQA